MTHDLDDRMHFAIDLARRAGELGLKYFRDLDNLAVESKGHQDLVSEADREVELFIRAAIAEAYPQDGIVGEEHAAVTGTTGHVWVIDPIDGTANFVRGIPAWCVVIACARDGETIVGVIHEPSTDETFYARRGGGAFLNGKPIKASNAASLSDGAVGTGLSNRASTTNVVILIGLIMGEGGVFYRNASGALMLAYAAAGRLLGYLEEHMNAWDCLAGMLLVEEAGGTVLKADPKTVIGKGTRVVAGGRGIFPRLQLLGESSFGFTR
ncbi:inositol monophosphatase family protein [Mesorhizobium sp. ESP-6-4]|uniref:inositol monophosphatase family protein n=1 Tax=unclassified Mesorhizobium TaxID=325217 RepID=UPI00112D6163|nr:MULTISPECIES: inositol monophosphatase family protein [unclassified Mesorhizobium]MBZ9661563.1 inositol monophosphatase family protein [Mesorhizobium sp. ESP-6-4]MBZ9839997.1 inositol monophosphatase family protein [Mesorhizobium sp. CA3]MBZ9861422.1 inositol monophosphatase family protein [Mesorhizobium sp. CA12]MBZ9868649.1 inositol monophosphatase family protein [Mesorhizobium sp. CA15]TPI75390.1 inositol monophosphatase [Mesorhizobium sp. B2-8-9]